MAETHETIADIIAEMNRVEVCADGKPCLRDYADRLDAAHKREVDMLAQLVEELRSQRDMWFEELQTVLEKNKNILISALTTETEI